MRIIQTALKTKWLGSVLLLLSTLTLMQCSDDESPEAFSLDGEKFNMKNAKIYLTWVDDYNGYTYRDYIITDGTPTNDGSWSVEDYTDATFLIALEVGTKAEALAPGTYITKPNWGTATEDNIAYIYYEIPSDAGIKDYEVPAEDPAPSIKIKGNFDGGDNISLSFSGNLWDDDEEVLVPTKVNFSGTIIDVQ